MPKKSRERRVRRHFSRFHRRASKAKPAVALLGGLAVGPATAVAGYGNYSGGIWSFSGNKGQEFIDRLSITYFGYKPSDGSHFTVNQGGYIGTIGAVVGTGVHALANWTGLNRSLARMKMPFRI